MRRLSVAFALSLLCLAIGSTALSPPAGASTGRFAGLERALAWHAAHDSGMRAARSAEVGHPARQASSTSPAGPTSFRARRVQEISRDTLPPVGYSQPDTQTEPDIAVDPGHPNVVVATYQQGRFVDGGSADPGYATSIDSGKTWTKGDLPLLTRVTGGSFDRSSDPAVAFGPDGSVYIVTIPFDQNSCRSAVSIQRSTDHGLTFAKPVFLQDDDDCSLFNDKEWAAVDTFPGSPHYGRVYVAWSRFGPSAAPAELRYSDDQGATWSDLIDISGPGASTEGTLPLVQPNGDLTVVYDRTVSFSPLLDEEMSQTSHDGGLTWDRPVDIGTFEGSGVPHMRTGGLPTAAVDPVTGDLYAAWQDTRFHADGLNDIVLSSSADGGASWSPLIRVNQDPVDSQLTRFTPDVAAYGGNVYVVFRTVAVVDGRFQNTAGMQAIVSTDGGGTWGEELTLGPTSKQTFAALAPVPFLGDYMGVAAWGRSVHVVWNVASHPPIPEPFHQTTWGAAILQ